MNAPGNAENAQALLRAIPKVDRLLASPVLLDLASRFPRARVVKAVRTVLDELRTRALQGALAETEISPTSIEESTAAELARSVEPYYRHVVNATGVILHTGIGRAVLPEEAVAALAALAGTSQRLEIDLETGQRGGRDEGCAALVRELTGCEAATVVNNNAAATILILAAMARGKGVILSRGELVEIGGSFRIPEVMEESGARLVEVGTTNRTHLWDYERAIGPDIGMLLKVHTSNYRIQGFTGEVEVPELVGLGRKHGIPVVHDMGSGCLIDLAPRGFAGEALVRQSLEQGADLVCFSGDKLLGGPQAGIIAGTKAAVERCRRHPFMRAMRPGRLIYTALEQTLRLYVDGVAEERVPALRCLLTDLSVLKLRAEALVTSLAHLTGITAEVVACQSQAGSGSMPTREFPSWGVRVTSRMGLGADELARRLRTGYPAVLPRVVEDGVLLDARTLKESDFATIQARLGAIHGS